MLLFSFSLLVALYAKGRIATPVFVIISYAIWTFMVVRWGIVSDVDMIPVKAIMALSCGVALHECARFMRRKEKLNALRLAKVMAWALFLVLVLVSALIVAKAISDADKIVNKQDVSSIEWKPLERDIKPHTEETIGFGIAQDGMLYNEMSGQLTSRARRALHDKYKEERENEWTLLDEALTTSNTLYGIAFGMRVDVLTPAEKGFKAHNILEFFGGIPVKFHRTLARSDSPLEALAMKARIQEYLGNVEKLKYSGWSGIGVMFLANLADV